MTDTSTQSGKANKSDRADKADKSTVTTSAPRHAEDLEPTSAQQRRDDPSPAAAGSKERNTYRTVRDLVERMRSFRDEVAQRFEEAGRMEDERAERFVADMARRQQQAADLLSKVENGDNAALDAWRQYLPTQALDDALAEAEKLTGRSADEVDLDDVIARVLRVEAEVAQVYRQLAESMNTESGRDFFSSLADLAESAAADRSWAYHETRQA